MTIPSPYQTDIEPAEDAESPYAPEVFLGDGPAVRRLRLRVARIAPHFRVALLTGESGAGKRTVAQQMHLASPAAGRPFTVIPSADFAQHADHPQYIGTLYLPGIDALHPNSQSRLLRALRVLHRETRIVVASQRDLKALVSAGRMRQDLYESVGTLEIRVAPLRQRPEDLDQIAASMMRRIADRASFAATALDRMHQHPWPGNLEELYALCEQLAPTGTITDLPHLPKLQAPAVPPAGPTSLEEVMRRHVMDVLQTCAGNKLRAAELLGISRSTLYRMLGSQTLSS